MQDFTQFDKRFDRLTPEAQQVLGYSVEEARRFQHNYIGTEHLLLGLVRLEEGITATVLKKLGVELHRVRSAVEFIIGRGDRVVLGQIVLTPRAMQVIELAVDEAKQMSQELAGPEHLLLGLVREGEGIAAGVLESLGVNLPKVRRAVYEALGRPLPPEAETPPGQEPPSRFSIRSQQKRVVISGTLGSPGMEPPIAAVPPMAPLAEPLHHYRPWHIEAAQSERAPVGLGAIPRPVFGPPTGRSGDVVYGTLLGWVVVNTGGAFTLSLYDGLEAEKPPLAVISNPPTGAYFPFHCFIQRGLTYTLEGTPGSVTIIYDEGI